MSTESRSPDVVIVGAGIAGASLAIVLARAGLEVAAVERQREYRDRVRGEYLANWGVLEARELGLEEVLRSAGGATARYRAPYDELMPLDSPAAALQDTSALLDGVEGGLCASHPGMCRALSAEAEAAGARFLRGSGRVVLEPGPTPELVVEGESSHRLRPRLVVGADGRNSTIRAQAGIKLRATKPCHEISGMLVEGMEGWPVDRFSAGTEGDLRFLIFPQPKGRLRLYTSAGAEVSRRWAGAGGPARFLAAFARLTCLPGSERFACARVAGPCATFGAEDTWTPTPYAEGVALVGDAGGYDDPLIGQGLSLALRDVRVLSETLLASRDWSPAGLRAYGEERTERLRRQRRVAATYAAIFSTFTEQARARRRSFLARSAAGDAATRSIFASMFVGPERLPAELFTDEFHDSLLESLV